MIRIDLTTVEKIITEVAQVEIMPRFRSLAASDIEMKGVNDPVTVADKAAEAALTARLTDTYRGSVVVGEESFAADPAIASRLGGDDDVWVIDPIDGTRNFIAGDAEFGVMVALVRRGKTVAAWIHDPNTGDTLMAEQGGGVWLRGHKMRLAGLDAGIPAAAMIGSRLKKALSKPDVAAVLARLPELVVGSAAAFDYARLFTGDVVFADNASPRVGYLLYRQCKPWDHLPGLMMHAEALGYAADFNGAPYDVMSNPSGLLVAPDVARWEEFHAAIGSVLPSIVME